MTDVEEAPRCGRRRSSDGQPCQKFSVRGTSTPGKPGPCATHGGRAPQVKAAAQRRLVEAEVARTVSLLDPEPVTDVLGALSRLAGRVVRWEQICAERVETLGEQLRYTAVGAGTEQLRAEVAVFQAALAECRTTLATIAKLNLDERLARVTEAQVVIVLAAIDVALRTAGVTGDAAVAPRAAAARHLRGAT